MAVKKQRGKLYRILRNLVLALFLLGLAGGVLVGCNAVATAPDVTNLKWNSSTVIMDRSGNEVYRLHAGENRTPVKLDEVPEHVVNAFVSVEDPNFYKHHGVDFRGIARAVVRSSLYMLGLPGGRLEGGSTITQQLARDAWLSQEVSIKRKVQEAWVALQLERTYSKDEIMEMYLNQIYFGHGAYGIEAAARTFFAKEVGQLTLSEGAQLAGMINGPSIYDPYEYPEASLERRDLVLDAMRKVGTASESDYQQAKAETPNLGSKKLEEGGDAGYFTDYVINILQAAKPGLAEKYGLKLGQVGSVAKAGLKVYTTLDPDLQKLAQETVTEQMAQADREYGIKGETKPQAAMVVMNPKTGEVLAMVGGRDHEAMLEFNRATDALRQPGSSIKPLVAYLPALDAGLSPATILDDAPVRLTEDGKTVWPQNYDFKYLGLKPMRYGVEQSLNPMAVRAMQAAGGPDKGAEYARKLGLSTIEKDDENLALALGGITKGVSVLDMTTAYSAIANMGTKVDPVVISKIVDRDGKVLFEARTKKTQVVRPETAYLMIDMMKDVIKKGTAYGFTKGFKGWPAAGKTGTTEFNRDGWFIGFTPDLVTTVWNGYDNPDNKLPWTGAFVPVKIWNRFMTQAVTERPDDWGRPAEVVSVKICKATGMLPADTCPKDQIGSDLFIRGAEPTDAGNLLVKAKVIPVSGGDGTTQWQLWQPMCLAIPTERVFINRPEPRVLHPTDPYNPKYVPLDAKDELPTTTCQPSSWLEKLVPNSSKDNNGNGKGKGKGSKQESADPAAQPENLYLYTPGDSGW